MNKSISFGAAITMVCVSAISYALLAAPVQAEPAHLPYGDYITASADWAMPIVLAGIAWLFRKIPPQFASLLQALRVDQLLEKAVGWGLNSVKGAVAGKVLDVETGNKVLNAAVDYAIQHAPQVVELAGGPTRLKEKILARLLLDETATLPAPAIVVAK